MTVDHVVKPIQYARLMKIQEKIIAEMKNRKLYKGKYKEQELTFEKPDGLAPKPMSCIYEVFGLSKEIFIKQLLALGETHADVRLAATPEIRQHYIEQYRNNDTNSNNTSALESAIRDYHMANEKRSAMESKTHKRSRDEFEADESKSNNIEIKQILATIDGIINADPAHYKNYLALQEKNSNWFSSYLTLAYARAHGINLCLWMGDQYISLGEESIPAPTNSAEIKETMHVVINLGDYYQVKPQQPTNNNAMSMSHR